MVLSECGKAAKEICEALERAMPNATTPKIDRILLLEELRQARLKQERLAKRLGEDKEALE